MRKLRVAMIGCGRIAETYRESFKQLRDEIEVRYAVDVKGHLAQGFAKDFERCVATEDYKTCFSGDVDVIHIATPHHMHAIIAQEAMKHGIHVLTEKPMSIYLQDADAMIHTAREAGVKLGVIFQTRYVEGYQAIKKMIREGQLGKVLGARSYLSWDRSDAYYSESDWKGTWDKEGGGVLIDQAIHSIDRVQDLIGSEVDWIEASMDNRNHKVVDVEDVAEAFVKFDNGCLYQLYACNCYTYDAPIQIEIACEKGRVGLRQDVAWVHLNGEDYYEIRDRQKGITAGPSYWGYSHIMQIQDFYDAIREDKQVTIDGMEGRKALEIIRGIYHAATLHKRVDFPFVDKMEGLQAKSE